MVREEKVGRHDEQIWHVMRGCRGGGEGAWRVWKGAKRSARGGEECVRMNGKGMVGMA